VSIRICLAWFVLHFLLIFGVGFRETFWLIGHGLTLLPAVAKNEGYGPEAVPAAIPERDPRTSNLFRQTLASYAGIAGIDVGYGYFAPNVPSSYRLSFELHYADGRVEHALPRVHSFSAGLRMAGLIDQIGRTSSQPLREHMVEMLAQSLWRTHPEVKKMRALLEAIVLPSVVDFQRGKRQSLQFLYAYDFSLAAEPGPPIIR
jgi:hypothetical protein